MKRFSSVVLLGVVIALVVPCSAAYVVYTNGPINGTINAWGISGIYGLANSFVSTGPVTVTGFDAGIWMFPGDTPTTVTWEILTGGPDWMGGTIVASGDGTWSNVFWGSNSFGADIYTSTISGLNVPIGAGTYWLELLNGQAALYGWVFWDENDGPSQVFGLNEVPDGSNAFTIYGTPEPGTILMLGSGIIGVAGVLRRKIDL